MSDVHLEHSMRRVDDYSGRYDRVIESIKACPGAEEFVEQLVKHFFPEPTDWDVSEADFTTTLQTITPHEVDEVIEDLGLRSEREVVFQCQHCGRYYNITDAKMAWTVDFDRSTDDSNQLVVVPTAACGDACAARIRKNAFRVAT